MTHRMTLYCKSHGTDSLAGSDRNAEALPVPSGVLNPLGAAVSAASTTRIAAKLAFRATVCGLSDYRLDVPARHHRDVGEQGGGRIVEIVGEGDFSHSCASVK